MEQIQSAIAKARAARDQGLRAAQAPAGLAYAPPLPGGVPLPGATPVALPGNLTLPGAAPLPQRPTLAVQGALSDAAAAAWMQLATFTPRVALMRRNHVATFEGGPDAGPYDVMRTKLLQQMRANNWRRVAITSPGAGCGKTTTALNLAFSLARQPEQRTILCEIDMRRPAIAGVLGLTAQQRFASVLEGNAAFAQHALRFGPNLAIATSHQAVRNPAELLQSATTAAALAQIEADYDPTVMIFDMPPMLVSDDTMAFMGQVDCVLIVAAAEKTTVAEVDVCERELAAQTNVLGVVLNKCRFPDRRYGYSQYA